jgi:hypothetical protein
MAQRKARKLSDQLAYESEAFLKRLRGLDASDLGMLAALAGDLHYRMLHDGDRVDLYNPEYELMRVPDLLDGLTALGVKMQRSGLEARVPGIMLWVHTLRACRYLEVRYAAKQMWLLAEKGFVWADDGAQNLKDVLGFEVQFDRPLRVPVGFAMEETKPVQETKPPTSVALKNKYREVAPLLAELLQMQRLFTGDVRLVDGSGRVNAMALGYIYGLTCKAFEYGKLDIESEDGQGVVVALIAEFDRPNLRMLWDFLRDPRNEKTMMDGVKLGYDDYRQFAQSKGAAGAPPLRWRKCFENG